MKSLNSVRIKLSFGRALVRVLVATAMLVLGSVSSVRAGDNPGVFPQRSHPYGESYGEWVVDWWQWALSIPADRNPLTDPTGEFAGESQHGPVWFVAGTFGDSAERSYKVPVGKALFVPVFVWIFGAGAYDCNPSVPGVPCVVCDLKALAAANTAAAEVLEVTVDGVRVQNVQRYEASSPEPFSVRYPDNSVVGLPAGRYFPQVADGYWLMLKPLAKGKHDITIHVSAPNTSNGPIEFNVIHHIEVTAPAKGRDNGPEGQD